MFDLDKIINNPNVRLTTDFGAGGIVTGFMTEDQSFAFGNNYDAPFESLGRDISGTLNKLSTAIGALAPGQITALPQMGVKSVLQTIYAWQSSERMRFTCHMIFVALRAGDDVRQLIAPFIRATNPTYKDFIVTAPLGYNANGMTAMGAAQVNIGQWFSTTPVMVVKDFQLRFARGVIGNKTPLYCIAQVTFESYRMLSAEEVLGFFKIDGSNAAPSASSSYPSLTPTTRSSMNSTTDSNMAPTSTAAASSGGYSAPMPFSPPAASTTDAVFVGATITDSTVTSAPIAGDRAPVPTSAAQQSPTDHALNGTNTFDNSQDGGYYTTGIYFPPTSTTVASSGATTVDPTVVPDTSGDGGYYTKGIVF